ncbi:MAG: CYTH domain-containing protein [Anaerovoracaceae bacterium]
MEIELKYAVTDKLVSEKILEDQYLTAIKDKNSDERIKMDAVYFDTADGVLRDASIALRVRRENNKIISTIKWNGSAEDGLHIREEINIPVDDEKFLEEPKLDIFDQCPMGEILRELVGDKKMVPIMQINFVRKQMRIDTGKSISVISLDKGEIITDKGNAPISELEIELYSGDKDDLSVVGETLAEKYNLVPENTSKYKRGLDLIR